MTIAFIDLAKQGEHAWWRYVVGIGVVLFFWLILGSLPFLAAVGWVALDKNPNTTLDMETGTLEGIDPILSSYLLPNLAFPLFLLGMFLVVRVIHRRPLRTLITPQDRIAWTRLLESFAVWFVLAIVTTAFEYALHPGAFRWSNVAPLRYLGFAMLAIIFTSLQTMTEELFFRGYLLQGLGQLIQQPSILAAVNGLLFMLPHTLNPEVASGVVLTLLYYWAIGAFFTWLTLKENRLELALGVHAANNLFVALFVNFKGSALYTPALVMSNRLDPLYNLLSFIVMAGVFYLVVFAHVSPPHEPHN